MAGRFNLSTLAAVAIFCGIGGGIGTANADIVWTNDFVQSGTGLGHVTTALTFNTPQGGNVENGCVGWNGSATFTGTGACPTGFTHIGTEQAVNNAWSVSDLGLVNAADGSTIRIVFNAQEPGNANDKSIWLEDLILTLWDENGVIQFTSGNLDVRPQFFADPPSGNGVSGSIFKLDAADALAVGAFLGNADWHFGLAAGASSAEGAHETFFLATVDPTNTPEPMTLGLLGAGLAGLAMVRRKRRTA